MKPRKMLIILLSKITNNLAPGFDHNNLSITILATARKQKVKTVRKIKIVRKAIYAGSFSVSCIMLKNDQTYTKIFPVFTLQNFQSMFDHFSTLCMKDLKYALS